MNCHEIKEYLYPFLDGELDNQASQLVKEHLSSCPLCDLEFKQERDLNNLIREGIPREKASFELRERIIGILERKRVMPLRAVPAGIVAILLLVISVPSLFRARSFPVFSEAITHHIHFLQDKTPMEISSGNTAEIKKWLQDRMEFMVMVPDLSQQGLVLLGARVCHLGGKKVAYLMYEKGEHDISVFMFDAKGMRFPKAKRVTINKKTFYLSKEKGYNSALWIDEGIACVFVSDLSEAELVYLANV